MQRLILAETGVETNQCCVIFPWTEFCNTIPLTADIRAPTQEKPRRSAAPIASGAATLSGAFFRKLERLSQTHQSRFFRLRDAAVAFEAFVLEDEGFDRHRICVGIQFA